MMATTSNNNNNSPSNTINTITDTARVRIGWWWIHGIDKNKLSNKGGDANNTANNISTGSKGFKISVGSNLIS
jgi:hypothetical protein